MIGSMKRLSKDRRGNTLAMEGRHFRFWSAPPALPPTRLNGRSGSATCSALRIFRSTGRRLQPHFDRQYDRHERKVVDHDLTIKPPHGHRAGIRLSTG